MSDWDFEYYENKFTSMWGANVGRYLANEFHRMMEGLDCIDNHRYAQRDNINMMHWYKKLEKAGCCGSVDLEFICEGKSYWLGFNYGH